VIQDTNVPDLTGLNSLDSIFDAFSIRSNLQLINFNGLSNLKHIGNADFRIESNPVLQDLSGIDNLETIDYSINIANNPTLSSLTGLESLKTVGYAISILRNDKLPNLEGLNNLISVGHRLQINDNDMFTSLQGLDNIYSIDRLQLDNNIQLQDLSGLSSLHNVGAVSVHGNPIIQSLNGLENVSSIDRSLSIYNNASLNNINALTDVDLSSMTNLSIKINPLLSLCSNTAICNYLLANGSDDISDNAVGCNGLVEVLNGCNNSGIYYFIGGVGYWDEAFNWSGGLVPDSDSDVVIVSGNTCNIRTSSTANCKYLDVRPTAVFNCPPTALLNVHVN